MVDEEGGGMEGGWGGGGGGGEDKRKGHLKTKMFCMENSWQILRAVCVFD